MALNKENMVTTAKEQTQAPSTPPASDAQEQKQSSELAFSQLLDQQIAQAIRPVMDEFRQQMAQELAQQTVAMSGTGVSDQTSGTKTPSPPTAPPEGQQAAGGGAEQVEAQPQGAKAKPEEIASQPAPHPSPTEALTGALRPGLAAVEQQVEPILQSALVALVGAMLAESTHAAIQQQAEHGLHALLDKVFEALPESMSNQETRVKTEGLLQSILQEFLDAVFAQTMRTTVQQKSQQAIQDSFHGDIGSALGKAGDMLKAIADALIGVLRRNQQNLVRLALALAVLALAGYIAQSGSHKEK